LFPALGRWLDRQNNVVLLIGELEDQLHARQLVGNAEINGGGLADKIHGFRRIPHP